VPAVGLAPSRPVVEEDVRDLQQPPPHEGGGLRRRLLLGQGQMVERACDRSQQIGSDLGVACGGVELRMSEQNLDNAHVGMARQKVGCEAVPQRVRRDPGLKPGDLSRHMAGTVQLPRRDGQARIAPREQPALRPALPPPGARHFEQQDFFSRRPGAPCHPRVQIADRYRLPIGGVRYWTASRAKPSVG
jgi:hypothetical protein